LNMSTAIPINLSSPVHPWKTKRIQGSHSTYPY
jgi:hypothetical protein